MTNMEGKVVIVTGANSGIGKETAKSLAKMGAKVIMACRNMETANQARDEILLQYPDANLVIRKLDLSSFKSVREFAAVINETEPHLDVLLHNAGLGGAVYQSFTSVDGLEMVMATNYFGQFLLTHLLIDLLKRSAPSRIVIVSSVLHQAWPCTTENYLTRAVPFFQYCKSKCGEVRFTVELAKRLEGTGVTANCLHPGVINTDIYRNVKFPASILVFCMKMCMKKISEGILTSIYAVTAEELRHTNGKYFVDCAEKELAKKYLDDKVNIELWDATKKVVKLTDVDPKI
ncbi:retinol dehydrogenase 14-like isoform X3 [Culicoides brevitarsis]